MRNSTIGSVSMLVVMSFLVAGNVRATEIERLDAKYLKSRVKLRIDEDWKEKTSRQKRAPRRRAGPRQQPGRGCRGANRESSRRGGHGFRRLRLVHDKCPSRHEHHAGKHEGQRPRRHGLVPETFHPSSGLRGEEGHRPV